METQKLSIHRALAELKIIGDRIGTAIEEFTPTGIAQKDKPVNGKYDRKEFEESAKAKYQSIIDLITHRDKIKGAVVISNASTKVKIAGQEMTVAQAIDTKATIPFTEALIEKLRKTLLTSTSNMEKNNAQVDANALKLVEVSFGKDKDIKSEDAQTIMKPFKESNEFSLIDPIKAEDKISELKKRITDFKMEVDAALSESNATTFIEI